MARKLRVQYPGAIYNVPSRGDRREPIFKDDHIRVLFLKTLGEACADKKWTNVLDLPPKKTGNQIPPESPYQDPKLSKVRTDPFKTTTWSHDIYGRPANKVDAAGNTNFAYQFDANNRPTNRWTPVNTNTTYSYSAVGQLTNVLYFPPFAATNSYAFDALGRLTNMFDGTGNTAYTYDSVGELLGENGPWDDDAVNYTYNNRLRASLGIQQPNADSWTQTYSYDLARRLTGTTSGAGGFTYQYDGLRQMQVEKLFLPNGSSITNAFDNMARLLSTTLVNSGGTNLNSHAYTYDVRSQRTSQTRVDGSYVRYTNDNIGQLIAASGYELGGVTNRLNESFKYAYDAAHNLSIRTNNAPIEDFNVNALNELSTVTHTGTLTVEGTTGAKATGVTIYNGIAATLYNDNTFAAGGFTVTNGSNAFTAVAVDSLGRSSTNTVNTYLPTPVAYTYDLNGNLLSDGTRYFVYDGENQLITVYVTNSWQSQFVYDGRLRRRIRKEFNWQGGGWRETNEVHYIYDKNVVVQERDGNNLPITTYTRGKDLSGSLQRAGGAGGMLAFTRPSGANPQHYYYSSDGNGNVTVIINNQQIIAGKYLYDPFGNTLAISGPMANANSYRFSSKEWHGNSGLLCFLCRYLDPNLQRWVNRDPIGERGGVNLFSFVVNNAINGVDPHGRVLMFAPGASPEFEQYWIDAMNLLSQSQRGLELLQQASALLAEVVITPLPDTAAATGDSTPGLPPFLPVPVHIGLDPCSANGVSPGPHRVMNGEVPPATLAGGALVLGHELGHVFGYEDESWGSWGDNNPLNSNVQQNENPIAHDLGIPVRGVYTGPDDEGNPTTTPIFLPTPILYPY